MTHTFRAHESSCTNSGRLAALVCALQVAGCPLPDEDDIHRKRADPSPFYLDAVDEEVVFQISVCTDGNPDIFHDVPPVFRVRLSASVTALPPTDVEMRLEPPHDEPEVMEMVEAGEASEVTMEGDFLLTEQLPEGLCSGWGNFTTTRSVVDSTSHIMVEWHLLASVQSGHKLKITIFVR